MNFAILTNKEGVFSSFDIILQSPEFCVKKATGVDFDYFVLTTVHAETTEVKSNIFGKSPGLPVFCVPFFKKKFKKNLGDQ